MGRKKIKYKPGDVVRIPLEDNYHTYARVAKDPFLAYYDLHVREPILDVHNIIDSPVLFVLASHDTAIEDGRWPIIGHVPLAEKPIAIPDHFIQDVADPTNLQILSYPTALRPATLQECEELERAAVWAVNHIEGRLNDHFAGRVNGVVERMKLKKF
jgi:hypothetical protein